MSGDDHRAFGAYDIQREARVAATLEHPHVVPVYESGDFERYIAKVFDDALRSDDAATQAKRACLGAYNKLRPSRGRPAVGDDF